MAYMTPQVILLREGTDTSQGKAQFISNINACCAATDIVRTTLVRRRRVGTPATAAAPPASPCKPPSSCPPRSPLSRLTPC